MKRFVIEDFPDDLARRLAAYLAIKGLDRRSFIVGLIEKALPDSFTVAKVERKTEGK